MLHYGAAGEQEPFSAGQAAATEAVIRKTAKTTRKTVHAIMNLLSFVNPLIFATSVLMLSRLYVY